MTPAKTLLEFALLFRDLSPAQQEAAERVIGEDYEDADPDAAEAAYWMLSIMGEDSIEEAWTAYRRWRAEQADLEKEEDAERRKALLG